MTLAIYGSCLTSASCVESATYLQSFAACNVLLDSDVVQSMQKGRRLHSFALFKLAAAIVMLSVQMNVPHSEWHVQSF